MRKQLSKLFNSLSKTRRVIAGGIRGALGRGRGLDDVTITEIEDVLIAADMGVDTSRDLVRALKENQRALTDGGDAAVATFLATEIEKILRTAARGGDGAVDASPLVTMVVGVNGVGKTTSIGKLSHMHAADGRSVLLACADTFRAAAREQLEIWADRSGASFVGGQSGGDPAAVAFDAMDAARSRGTDVLFVDTAGRLHTETNLMQELEKIKRVLGKNTAGAPHEILLVLDANTGQNAISQARLFDQALGLTGVILTKMDGTAKGGIVVAIARELGIPVRYVGTGEQIEDIEPFDVAAFSRGITGAEEPQ